MKYLCGFVLFLMFCGCNSLIKDNNCNSIFTESEIRTQKQIVHYLDSIVIHDTGENDIEFAYRDFFENEIKKINETGSMTIHKLNYTELEIFLRSLNRNHLKEYYTIRDTASVKIGLGTDSLVFDAFEKDFEFDGKYMELLSCLSGENEFIKLYIDNLNSAGGFSSHFSSVIKSIDKFNLDDESERLVIAITIFSLNRSYRKL